MRQSRFKNTTSLVMSLALVTTPVFAQDVELPECGDEPEFPCLSIDGDVIDDMEAFEAFQEEEALAAEQERIDAELNAAAEAEAEAAAAAAEAESQAAADAAAEEAAQAEAQATADAAAQEAADADAQAAADEAAAAQEAAEAEAQAAADAAAAAAADAAAQADEQAAADAEAAAAEAEAAEQAEAEAEALAAEEADALAAEQEAAAEAEAQAEEDAAAEDSADEAEALAEEEAAANAAAAEAEADAAEEAAALEDDAAATEEEAAAEAEAEALAAEEAAAAEAEADAAAQEAEATDQAADADTAETAPILSEATTMEEQLAREETPAETEEEAPVASAAAMADDDMDVAPDDAEVETDVVTEDETRSSVDEFATTLNAEPAPTVQSSDDDDGLSTFQKALLLGLGAAVVGTVLRNGDQVVANSGDRVVVQRGDNFVVLKDDDVLLRQPGSEVETQTFNDGSSRTIITREDGTRVITIRGADGTVQRRARVLADGTQVELFNDTVGSAPVVVSELPPAPMSFAQSFASVDTQTLRQALAARERAEMERTFSLNQIRTIPEVRNLAPAVELDTLTFASGSAAIDQSQTAALTDLGLAINAIVENDPSQMFLVEGHTDAVGSAAFNLALSDRRAETVALALTEFFGVPPENLVTQGYGERFLKVPTLADERANRRVAIRNVSSLLQ